jgi:outer membrane protein OmpA-like peptidoglycan-associated protein
VAALGLEDRNAWGMQFRIGFHRGVRLYAPPAPPRIAETPQPRPPLPELPPIEPLPVENRPPTVKAICNPCRIEVGQSTVINANSQDPDGDKVTLRWTTIAGTLEDPRGLSTKWVAETIPGTVVLTVTAEDGRGGVATDAVNVEVVRRPPLVLDEVYFDLDQDTLRPDGIAVLNKVVEGLKQNPMATVRIEGPTSNEASEKYNYGLGERRAERVQEYLTTNGIAASRLQTTSLGENSPKYDNSKEETRQLNRRAAFVVIAQ